MRVLIKVLVLSSELSVLVSFDWKLLTQIASVYSYNLVTSREPSPVKKNLYKLSRIFLPVYEAKKTFCVV